ncbi:MAG: aminopeptidase P N-terminal domain-containing protein, partial [Flavobacteriales bacterium]|nr:aminopeptidase P N-terminal domain-containing protein [Flavobacteriales bacterium]
MTRSLILPVLLSAFLTAHAQEPQAPIHLSGETYGLFDNDLLTSEFHKERREALRNKMPNGGVAVLFANPVRNRSNDVDHEYHQDPDLYYLSGLDEPNGLLIVFKEPHRIAGEQVRELLVVQERDPAREVWNGHRLGTQGAQERLGVEAAVSGAAFLGMDAFLGSEDILFMDIPLVGQAPDPNDPADLSDLIDGFTRMSSDVRQGASNDLMKWMAELREVKGPEELALMRKAIDITCLAQNELMAKLRPEMTEYQTEA